MDTRSTRLFWPQRNAWRRAGARLRWQILLVGGLLVAFALLSCPRALGAGTPAAREPASKVTLLVASRSLDSTVWKRTVVLVTPLSNGAHLGIILNRPTAAHLGQLFPGHAPSQRVHEPVYFGGPVSVDALVALVDSASNPSAQAIGIAHGVYLAVDAATIDRIIEERPERARFYVGFVLWPPAALEQHVAAGLWTRREAEPGVVFRKDTVSLWSDLAPASDLPGGLVGARPGGCGCIPVVAVRCNDDGRWLG